MRCNNCGWMNPDHLSKCQKCNQEIKVDTCCDASMNKLERPLGVGTVAFNEVICSNCGYPYQKENTACPNCGTVNIQQAHQVVNTTKTAIIDSPTLMDYDQVQSSNNNPFQQAKDNTTNANPNKFVVTQIDCNVNPKIAATMNIAAGATVAINRDADTNANSFKQNNYNFKKTVRDVFPQELDSIVTAEKKKEIPQTDNYSYKMLSLDVAEENKFEILITTPRKLELKSGDIILIAGLRYKML